jgi:glycosyltransferase involved in cell wall biosynthesis
MHIVAPMVIGAIGVVVPARNEEQRLARCLDALQSSASALRDSAGEELPVRIVVVDDCSTDATAQIAGGRPNVEIVRSSAGRVGGARRLGIRRLLRSCRVGGLPPDRVWIACTDADSAVPPEWLQIQLQHARAGVDLLLGTVRPDPTELAGGVLAAWRLRHRLADGHPHVHGANLGVRGDTYLAAGGFRNVAAHEDVLLRDAVRALGGIVVSTGSGPVLTSGRQRGRAPAGLAHYLRELNAQGGSIGTRAGVDAQVDVLGG